MRASLDLRFVVTGNAWQQRDHDCEERTAGTPDNAGLVTTPGIPSAATAVDAVGVSAVQLWKNA